MGRKPNTKKHSFAKSEMDSPVEHSLRSVLKGVVHDLQRMGFVANMAVGIVLLLMGPLILYYVKGFRGAVIFAGIGVTLIVWILVILILRNAGPAVEATKSRSRPAFRANSEKVTVTVGGNSLRIARAQLEVRRMQPLLIGDSSPLEVYVENGYIFVDATLFTRENLPPFQVRHNEYDNLPPQWDVNSTESILELVNDMQSPMLQIIHKSDSEVIINGVFLHPQQVVIATQNGMRQFGVRRAGEVINTPIQRIFKYPSFKYPGEFE